MGRDERTKEHLDRYAKSYSGGAEGRVALASLLLDALELIRRLEERVADLAGTRGLELAASRMDALPDAPILPQDAAKLIRALGSRQE